MRKNIRKLVVVFVLLLAVSLFACNGATTNGPSSLDGTSEPDSSIVLDSSSILDSGIEPDSSTATDSGNNNSSVEEECEHQAVVDEAVAPDCENTGLTEGSHCGLCGEILVAQEEVGALGHTEVIDQAVAPDCENTGLTEGKHCDVCGEILVAQEVVPIGDHNIVNGVCSVCGFSNVTDSSYFNFYYLDDGTYEILARDSSNLPENIVLPSVYNGVAVTAIYTYGFRDCNTLKSVVIPDSITIINDKAFQYCEALTSVRIGDGVKYIGSDAFYRCTMLSSLTIGKNVESIGSGAFADCESLTSVVIPNSVTVIEDAFANCNALTIYCEAQSKPDGWSNYWKSDECPVVWDCKNNDVADNGFIYTVVDGVRYGIKDGEAVLVRQPIDLTNGNLPSKITYGEQEYSVNSIENYAFYGCDGITNLVIPTSITSISDWAFQSCDGLISVVLHDNVTEIRQLAFFGCDSLYSIEIPSKVDFIGLRAFAECKSLVSITVDEANPTYYSVDGNLYSRRSVSLMQYAVGKKDTYFELPNKITSIDEYAFYGCAFLEEVVFSSDVRMIGMYTFGNCKALKKVVIPKNITSIKYGAFYGCYSLTIYCEAESKPSNWDNSWNNSNRPVYYYSETQPATSGNYWHYVNGEVVTW